MLDVTIILNNTEYSLRDYCIWVKHIDYGTAEVHTSSIEVPYRNGKIFSDLTSEPTYSNRTISMNCLVFGTNMKAKYSEAVSKFSGRKVKIISSDDPNYYYEGLITFGKLNTATKHYTAEISMDAYPYKKKKTATAKNVSPSSSGTTLTLNNSKMPTVPTFGSDQASTSFTVTYKGKNYSFNGRTSYRDAEIVLHEGNNVMVFKGSGSITVTYTEGVLE